MDDTKLLVYTETGEQKEMQILFTFDNEQYGKQYVIFFDPAYPEEYYSMSYDENGNLYPVEDDAENDMIEEMVEIYEEELANEE